MPICGASIGYGRILQDNTSSVFGAWNESTRCWGGGKHPIIETVTRQQLELTVTGLDICASELAEAPPGSYDNIIVGDVGKTTVNGVYDLIISHTVMEHVEDTQAAIRNLSGALAPNGTMVHFLPCGNAVFARANLIIGNRVARFILSLPYPKLRSKNGFPAYYNHCSPKKLPGLCKLNGLAATEVVPYYASDYLRFFTPLHIVDVMRQVVTMWLGLSSLCETFTVVSRKAAVEHEKLRTAA